MFGKQIRLRPFLGGIVVTAAIAVVGVPSALASTNARVGSEASAPDAVARFLLNHRVAVQQVVGYRFITDTLGGARQPVQVGQLQPSRFTSDTIADVNPYSPSAYVNGGASPAVAQAIQDHGFGPGQTPVVTGSSSGTSSNWRDIGIAALGALLLVLLLGAIRAGRDKPSVRTA
jgi:hypothetical protein